MARKVGEGPLLLTTALDELREEGTLSHGGDLDMGSAEGGAGGALAEDMSADNFAPVAVPAGDSKKKGVSPSRGAAAEQGNGGAGGAPVPSSSALAVAKAAGGAPFVPKPKPLPRQLSGDAKRERPSSVDGASGPSRGSCKMRSAGTLSVATVEREKKNVSGGSPGGGMSAFPAGSASLAAEVGSGGLAAVESPAGLPVVAPSPGGGVCEKAEITIGEGVRLLLEAYVLYRPDVGYVRGMDCLAAMLLCFLPLDLAFVALANLLPSFHLLDFFCPALPCNRRSIALKFDFFESMLRLRLPHLYRHLAGLQVIPDLYLMRWMETLFCRTLPFATLCRTWDGVLLMGEYHESELLCNSFEGCLSILNRHAQPTADEDGTFDAPRFFKCVEVCRIDSHQYGRWVANQRMSEEKAELLELVACSTV
ncbi:TBC domain-containing protein [Cyclospora cayetanensis]|uniref:TBC domain-containing protein n=1 Tax=Cyclospora cayetanensis TaxID=88456 RepID=A0A1D3D748_9EIME|nr:TBC domain-containing protein [Cyclospora cayetanensis]